MDSVCVCVSQCYSYNSLIIYSKCVWSIRFLRELWCCLALSYSEFHCLLLKWF